MFRLSLEEFEILKLRSAISTPRWGGRRKRPFAFNEHGAIMAAGVLNTPKAIYIMFMSSVLLSGFTNIWPPIKSRRIS
jgi:hypothetical protein